MTLANTVVLLIIGGIFGYVLGVNYMLYQKRMEEYNERDR